MTDFNKIIKAKQRSINDEFQERLASCLPIAGQIFEMMITEKLPMGVINDKKGEMKKEITEWLDSIGMKPTS